MPIIRLLLTTILVVIATASYSQATENWQTNIPESLRAWVPWVLKERDVPACPSAYNNKDNKICNWPGYVKLVLSDDGGSFTEDVIVADKAWVALPGNVKQWPQHVQVNSRTQPVVSKNNVPSIYLEGGTYKITGAFVWQELPESLLLPVSLGAFSLSVNGADVPFPTTDSQGNLWLKKKTTRSLSTDADYLDVKVFRKLTDSIPFEVTTHLILNISGKNREVQLKGALLPGFTVKQVTGALPVRLEDDGELRIKARAGTWTVDVTGYTTSPVMSLTLPAHDKTWPDNEIWAFSSQSSLRVVDVSGVFSIDPRQTDLPGEWHSLPAYLMKPGTTMQLNEKKRGDSEPQPDELSLNRELWLDFDGKGYTAKDTINGQVHKSSRVVAQQGMVLGRASVNGQDQFITTVEGDTRQGIEIQPGYITLTADSRMDDAKGAINAVGWAHDFNRVSEVLQLPPGWRLLAASGVDKVSHSWVSDWTLFDVFLVLFVTIAMVKLMGFMPGMLGLITLIFVHTELQGVGWLALFILAMIALCRVLPKHWFRTTMVCFLRIAQVWLILLIIPFMLYHMRDAIHPQLKGFYYGSSNYYSGGSANDYTGQAMMAEQKEAGVMRSLEMPAPPPMAAPLARPVGKVMSKMESFQGFYQYDPSISVQTGFGVANWQAERINLTWNGPVDQTQTVDFWLLSPGVNLLLACMRVILLLVLTALLFEIKCKSFSQCMAKLAVKKQHISCLLFLLMGTVFIPHSVRAEEQVYPPAELLNELQGYVTKELDKQPECLPQCAEISDFRLQAEDSTLMLYLEIHAAEDTAVPLPDTVKSWYMRQVVVDGKEGSQLAAKDGNIWLFLEKGVHDVVITGRLPERDTASINFRLKPHHAAYNVSGWELHGIHDDGSVDQSLQLVRIREVAAHEEEAFDATRIPPFVKVERNLYLGTSWTMNTRVIRLTPRGSTVVVSVPLLDGESVTAQDRQVSDGKMTVQMGPEDSVVSWSSVLKQTPQIVLNADKGNKWVESWQLHTTNLWHVKAEGIPKILGGGSNPIWRPWPGEKVTLNIVKPKGVAGPTKTIDKIQLTINAGQRAFDATLNFTIRSSKGGQHHVILPEGAVLQSVVINGRQQPLQQEGRNVIFPLVPGSQVVVLNWKQASGIATLFKAPDINMGIPSVNIETTMTLPQDRWVLFTGGSLVGPAVLFWGIFPVMVALAIALGFVRLTPLKFYHWLLLLLGLSQATLAANFIVVGWLLVIGIRQQYLMGHSRYWLFNTRQIIVGLWAAAAVISIFIAIKHGLLGSPDMKITGNGSSAYYLKWYQDIAGESLPRSWTFSVPVIYYRILMLAWALWLAFAYTGWLKWGWKCFSEGGIWRKTVKQPKSQQQTQEVQGGEGKA